MEGLNTSNIPQQKRRIVIVDDSPVSCDYWEDYFNEKFNHVIVETYLNPLKVIDNLNKDIFFLMIDWKMPSIDGKELLQIAKDKGVNSNKIIVISATPAHVLHENFKLGECLAVIEKGHESQERALHYILDAFMQKEQSRV
jgi:DNA-binding LytR/AlgR family response regulator